jgi:antitoxin component HigA of HigAB toxin-antitoxin module
MKKLSTIYLLGAMVMLGSCARQYPVFNQMPTNAYMQPKTQTQPGTTEKSMEAAATALPEAGSADVQEALAEVEKNPQVSSMLESNSPRQIDEQLTTALASTKGQELLAKPAIAAQINKVRAMMAQPEMQRADLTDVKSSKVSKLVDKSIKKHMAPEAAKALNRNLKLGLILIGAAVILSVIPGLWYLAGIVGLVGVVFAIIGLLDM